MSARPTPETDAEHREIMSALGAHHMGFVGLCFARNLERQRDEARELARELSGSLQEALEFFNYWDGVPMWAGLSDAQDAITKAKEVLP